MTRFVIPQIPDSLIKAIVFLRGEEEGQAWLSDLPDRITAYARAWNLRPEAIAEGGAMSCCVLCTTEGGVETVLKIPVDQASGASESELLDHWASTDAAPDVLNRDVGSGVFLMTRIRPGTTAWATKGPEDSHRFLELMARLNQQDLPAPASLQDISVVVEDRLDWARDRFTDPRYANDVASIEDAQTALQVLLQTTTVRHVLHADLQAKNILDGPADRWYAIDPLGAIGDLNSEAALWATIQDGPTSITDRLAELGSDPLLDPTRLKAWAFVFAVAEYRPYLPLAAQRMAEFLAKITLKDAVDPLSGG
jgi:streptomycin 6-kinase